MEFEPRCCNATRKELAEQARKHYEEVSNRSQDWLSTIPAAIDAWEREPELLEECSGRKKDDDVTDLPLFGEL